MMMTVEKLIEDLQAIEDKTRKVVVIDDDGFEYNIENVEASADGEPVVALFTEKFEWI